MKTANATRLDGVPLFGFKFCYFCASCCEGDRVVQKVPFCVWLPVVISGGETAWGGIFLGSMFKKKRRVLTMHFFTKALPVGRFLAGTCPPREISRIFIVQIVEHHDALCALGSCLNRRFVDGRNECSHVSVKLFWCRVEHCYFFLNVLAILREGWQWKFAPPSWQRVQAVGDFANAIVDSNA